MNQSFFLLPGPFLELRLAFARYREIDAVLKPQQLNGRIFSHGITCGSGKIIDDTLFQIDRASDVDIP